MCSARNIMSVSKGNELHGRKYVKNSQMRTKLMLNYGVSE